MRSELEQLVGSLGAQLDRSVALDDPSFQLLAYTAHAGEVDEARIAAIMQRGLSEDRGAYLRDTGVLAATDVFRVPARTDVGFAIPRVAMPIRHERKLLGFLWLLESDGPVDDAIAGALRDAATKIALALHRQFLLGEIERHRERELTRDLLSSAPELRNEAAALLADENLLASGPVTVLTVTLQRKPGESQDGQARLAVAVGLSRARARLGAGDAVQLERPDHGILLVARTTNQSQAALRSVAVALRKEALAEYAGHKPSCWVGIGRSRPSLEGALGSYIEAMKAIKVAREVAALGEIVHHDQLGVYSLLAMLSPEELHASLHPGLGRLRRHGASRDFLTETLEVYLDNAGSVKRTAAQLTIQPASIYYRLKRIEEVAEVDLSSGEDRLALHQSLKIVHLIGEG